MDNASHKHTVSLVISPDPLQSAEVFTYSDPWSTVTATLRDVHCVG